MLLGLDAFSVRWQGWTASETLRYAASKGLHTVQFSEPAQLGPLNHTHLSEIKRLSDELAVSIEVGMRSIDRFSHTFDPNLGEAEEQIERMLQVAKQLGSGVLRCFMGTVADRRGEVPFEKHLTEMVRVLTAASRWAEALGVTIAVENHGGVDLLARELRQLIDRVGSASVGVCLDTGNSVYAGEDPLLAAEVLGPFVATVQLRDTRVWRAEGGSLVQWVPMGLGNVDIRHVLEVVNASAPHVCVNNEVITSRPPKFLDHSKQEGEFWLNYPTMLARDFARFLNLGNQGAVTGFEQEELDPQLAAPTAHDLALFRAQQLRHVDASISWCWAECSQFFDSSEKGQS